LLIAVAITGAIFLIICQLDVGEVNRPNFVAEWLERRFFMWEVP
jgi:hypothetical protein